MSRVKYLFDEDLNGRIVRGARRRIPDLDSTTVQEADLPETSDPAVLDWAAAQGRIVMSMDRRPPRAARVDIQWDSPATDIAAIPGSAFLPSRRIYDAPCSFVKTHFDVLRILKTSK